MAFLTQVGYGFCFGMGFIIAAFVMKKVFEIGITG